MRTGAERIVFLHVLDEDLEIVELDVVDTKCWIVFDPSAEISGPTSTMTRARREVGVRSRHRERDVTAHRVAEHDGIVEPLVSDERDRVAHHGVDRVVLLTVPL